MDASTGKLTYELDERIPQNLWIKKPNALINQYWDPDEERPTTNLTDEMRRHAAREAKRKARHEGTTSQTGVETDDEMKLIIDHLNRLDTRTIEMQKQQAETHQIVCDMREENNTFFNWMRENYGGFQKDYVELKGKFYSKFPPSMGESSHGRDDESAMPTNDLEDDDNDSNGGGGGDFMEVETGGKTRDDFE